MEQKSTERLIESRPDPSAVVWEHLEAFARRGVQDLLQRVLEEEVEGVLRRGRYELQQGIDAPGGYRNGFGKPRRLSLSVGTITVRRPRVRGLAERVLAALRDGRKVIVAVESGHRESTESWAALLRDLRRRGLRAPRLVIGDGHLGI